MKCTDIPSFGGPAPEAPPRPFRARRLCVGVLCIAAAAFPCDHARPQPTDQQKARREQRLLEEYDANKDGVIDATEREKILADIALAKKANAAAGSCR